MSMIEIRKVSIINAGCDGIVNAANSSLQGGAGVCGAIFKAAGWNKLQAACDKYGHCNTGKAVITPAFAIAAKYIIHTVGPIVEGPLTQRHVDLLKSCYRSILELAQEKEIRSLALCCISTGVFMFPNQKAGQIAVSTVREFLSETNIDMKIIFNVYKDIDYEIYQRLLHAE